MNTSPAQKYKSIRVFIPIFLCSLILIYFVKLAWVSPATADTWTHLTIGKWVVTQKTIPTHENLSIKQTEPSLEWLSHSWLTDALLYLSAVDSPRKGAFLFSLPVSIFTLFLLYKILALLGTPKSLLSVSICFSAFMMGSFWHVHPYIILPTLLLGMILSYTHGVLQEKKSLWFLPPLFLLTANMSGGIIAVPLLWLGLTFCVELFLGLWKKTYAMTFVSTCILSAIATLFNPYGLRIWSYILTMIGVLQIKQWYTSLPGLLLLVNQNTLRESPASLYLITYGLFALFLLLGLGYSIIRTDIKENKSLLLLLPTILYGTLGWIFIRFIPTSTLILVPFSTLLVSHICHLCSQKTKKIMGIAGMGITLGVLLFFTVKPIENIQISPPDQALDIILKSHLNQNFLTTSEYTGYLLFQLFPNRMILDAQDDLFDEHETISIQYLVNAISAKTLEKVTMENKIQTALVNKDASGFALGLAKDPAWNLLYFDTNNYLFSSTASASTLENPPPTLTHLSLNRNLGFDPKDATETAKELSAFVRRYPDNQSAIGLLATVYRIMNRSDEAEKILNTIPKPLWTYILYTEMGRVKAAQGLCKSAEKEFETAINMRKETRFSRAILDLAVLNASCLGDKNKARHLFNRYNSFIIHPGEREEVRTLGEQFGIVLDE
ncbi:tetratricopeptide repeat protein [Candidatus Gottesmanbacteria bacterium]|nr:tetratricopeptide repeat protein [Candidatus Gottesmanbacteria bacterium]